MKRQISVNLELSNKEKTDGKVLVMIRLSENRKHVRFSTGTSVYQENFKGKKRLGKYLTESEHQLGIINESLNYNLAKTLLPTKSFITFV